VRLLLSLSCWKEMEAYHGHALAGFDAGRRTQSKTAIVGVKAN
jgi:hypothetical protein